MKIIQAVRDAAARARETRAREGEMERVLRKSERKREREGKKRDIAEKEAKKEKERARRRENENERAIEGVAGKGRSKTKGIVCATRTTGGYCDEEHEQDGVRRCHGGATRTERAKERTRRTKSLTGVSTWAR